MTQVTSSLADRSSAPLLSHQRCAAFEETNEHRAFGCSNVTRMQQNRLFCLCLGTDYCLRVHCWWQCQVEEAADWGALVALFPALQALLQGLQSHKHAIISSIGATRGFGSLHACR